MLRKAKQNPTTKERGAAAPKVKTIYIYYIKIHRQKSKFHKLTPLTLTLLELSWTQSNPVPTKQQGAATPKVPTIHIYYFKIHQQKDKFHTLYTEGGSPLLHPSDFDTVRAALDPEQPSAEQS